MNKLKLLMLLLTLLFVTACDVEFDEDLRAYIDNIVDRSPLDFTLEGDGVTEIDGSRAINLGHPVDKSSAEYTITNMEDVDIQIEAVEAVTGGFSIAALEAFTLKKGESFTLTITYNLVDESINKRINHSYELIDKNGRTFNFVIWATSRENPMTFYNATGDEEISVMDLGNWDDNREFSFIIKNEGLEDITISNFSSPSSDVIISDTNTSTLAINEEREVILQYNYNTSEIDTTVDDTGLIITCEYRGFVDITKTMDIIAGGVISLDVVDADNNPVLPEDAPVVNLGTFTEGDSAISETITIQNNTESDFTIVVTRSAEGTSGITFPSLEANITIEAGGTYPIQINFSPATDPEDKSRQIYLSNEADGRVFTITVEGVYSL